ncbi:MAG TPA: alpha/beta fold hydrolase, partial [Ilumatobacteraceae bacterium]
MSDWRRLEGPLAAWASGDGPRVVFVHGFTQTSNSWKPIAARLVTEGYESVVVDAPGHGKSTSVNADLREAAAMLSTMFGSSVLVGYSMGGRLCMHAALMHPSAVRGLALLGASPGIADEAERAARRGADDQLADHIIEVGVDAFIGEWTSQPLFAGLRLDEHERADRL